MKGPISLLLFLLLLGNAYAGAETILLKGTGVNCELIPEKEVLVYTRVLADEDGQEWFRFNFNLPGKPPYDFNEDVSYGQHVVFIPVAGDYPSVDVNGEAAMPRSTEGGYTFWTSNQLDAGNTPNELVKQGDNSVVIYLRPSEPVKKGDFIAEVAATTCSDAAFERALDAPVFPSDNPPTEVPEFGTWVMLVLGGLCGAALLTRKK